MNEVVPEVNTDDKDILYKAGIGNWKGFLQSGISIAEVEAAAAEWARELDGIDYPWLCWNVNSEWSVVQQRLVKAVGWTPLVGFDPRVGPPPIESGAILIDFNARFRLPTMWLHFPLEFAHLFSPRLAFWHADCLIRLEKMAHLAAMFRALPDGTAAAVKPNVSWKRQLAGDPRKRRYWEVVGCTTRGASRDQFDKGAGWWMNFSYHPSASHKEKLRRFKYYWDSGVGIRYWHKHYGGKIHLIPENYIKEGHFTLIGREDYKRKSPINFRRNLSLELSLNNDLEIACHDLGLESLLSPRGKAVPLD